MYVPNVEFWGIKSVEELLGKDVPKQEIVAVKERDFFEEPRKEAPPEPPKAAMREFRLFAGAGAGGGSDKGMIAAFWGGRQIAASGVTIPDKIRQNMTANKRQGRFKNRRQRVWLGAEVKEPAKVYFAGAGGAEGDEGGLIVREFDLVCGGAVLPDVVYREWWNFDSERENGARLAGAELGSKISDKILLKLLSKEHRFRLD